MLVNSFPIHTSLVDATSSNKEAWSTVMMEAYIEIQLFITFVIMLHTKNTITHLAYIE